MRKHSDNYTTVNCLPEEYCLKWTSEDFKYTGRGCFVTVEILIMAETGAQDSAVIPECARVDNKPYSIKDSAGKVLHKGIVYCCGKDLCNRAGFDAPTHAALLLGVIVALWMKA